MNAPYDGDRAQGTGGPTPSQGTAPGTPVPGQVPAPAPDHDPYVQDAYDYDPYRAQDLSAQDPVAEVLYDRASHPPPPPGTYQEPGPLYAAPQAPSHGPDPRVWAQTPPPEPDGPSRHLPYGDHATTTQFVGVDSLVTSATDEQPQPDAFTHLYRDQQAAPGAPAEEAPVAA
ncbi:murein biosynthesis integral membrane protein MurJ, partial [Streptomyces sp. NPDC048551]